MDIINSSTKKRTILLVSDQHHDLTALHELLAQDYRIAYFDNSARDFPDVKERAGNISAAIICATDAAAKDYALFAWLRRDSIIAAIPLLIYCDTAADYTCAGECLKRGAVDIISPPLHEEIIFQRIENAIRLKDSATFYEIEKMLKELPSNIYLKDDKGRYIFATHYWHHLAHPEDPEWTIRGKTDLEIRKDKENAAKAYQTDLEILRTGIGKKYIIEVNTDGMQEYLEIIKEPVRNDNGEITGIIALINDVTEKEYLRIQLEQSALKDALTGLRNNTAYSREVRRLEKEIREGNARFGLAMIDLNFLKRINDTYGHEQGNDAIKRLSRLVCGVFKHSPVFRFGGDEFIIILENDDLACISALSNEFLMTLEKNRRDARLTPWEKVSAAMGTAIFDKTADKTVADVFARADENMYACKKAMKADRRPE
ncbi:MAG: GGDEF domain-containing protein [Desulfovibrio desulfuricans]|jgi:diguanylate cyclase (GGDEF)-like protein|nr:GGDEF domain-containing protein [Desulfovibrio desulfuricans]